MHIVMHNMLLIHILLAKIYVMFARQNFAYKLNFTPNLHFNGLISLPSGYKFQNFTSFTHIRYTIFSVVIVNGILMLHIITFFTPRSISKLSVIKDLK